MYTVKVTLQDDDGPVVERTFTITVHNVVPNLAVVPHQSPPGTPEPGQLDESENLVVIDLGTVTDQGFNNPNNPLAQPGGSVEEFTFWINWGDGTTSIVGDATIDDIGSVGDLTNASFNGSHVYADDGTYTVTVRVADDDMSANFTSGIAGVAFVEKTFLVTVTNTNPSFIPVAPGGPAFQGDDISASGITTIRVNFTDPGFDNLANPNPDEPPNITDTRHESFTHLLDWGDGTIDAIHTYPDSGVYTVTVKVTGPGGTQSFTFNDFNSNLQPVLTLVSGQSLNDPGVVPQTYTYEISWGDGVVQTVQLQLRLPGNPLFSNGLTGVFSSLRDSGDIGVLTTGSFEVQHQYLGPPNPLNPTADIRITTTIVDDNNGAVSAFIDVPNPGIETVNVAIDTTPDVPVLAFVQPPVTEVFVDLQTTSLQGGPTTVFRSTPRETRVTGTRFLELVVVSPDGNEVQRFVLDDKALFDLRKLFSTLPDNHYRIYMVRTDNNTRRLVIDVYVRGGRVIDPSDDSEGTRDRPPTAEGTENQQPLEDNPLLEELPQEDPGAANLEDPSEQLSKTNRNGDGQHVDVANSDGPPMRRWTRGLASLALVGTGGNWPRELEAALEHADDRAWKRLRRAGVLGRLRRRDCDGRDRAGLGKSIV
jgi:hypothetical protein